MPAGVECRKMNFRNSNALWSAVFMQTLKNCGVRTAVVSPGSRSTPLTAASAEIRRLETVPVLDERSAGFFALGLAKSTVRPTVLICTSGTAAANYLPAVVEARMSRTPLIVVTADRPPEFQNCHAGQTIPQVGIFSHFPVWEKNCVPALKPASLEEAREAAFEAVKQSMTQSAPVHVNVQFRDPLAPSVWEKTFPGEIPGDFDVQKFCMIPQAPMRDFLAAGTDAEAISLDGKKVLIVAGTVPPGHDDTFNIERVSRKFSAPILADATHPLRQFPPARERLIERYDAIFRNAGKPYSPELSPLRPDVILQIGTLPESKFLRAWLESLGETPVYLFNYCGDNTDALARPNAKIVTPRFREIWNNIFCNCESDTKGSVPANAEFLAAWKTADARFKTKSDAYFKNGYKNTGTPTEPQIARFLCENLLESETAIFIANGMPVRDMNAFCPAGARFWAFHNRGANGIDGTLSTALGVAHGCMEQTILYTGDLSLLHDTNGFLIAPHFCGNLCIVLQNNGGGNIFRHLPVAKENPHFEKLWLTPQRADFEKIAAAYGVDYARAGTLAELGELLARFRSKQGIHLIEICTDGEASRAIRGELNK
ncbi:MAG: 2-succinyl-5-enolpyruvyl-6-hydroxy-3-cyclohexene-1-carboxylic-acid synthase [Verrucomicrobia bacterium]|nr:2-succinyl-5-enolpyruvyl-6-hydroxy-3-cyclohexene-1-carboxylic-acid synthase [Verrucomicrobiota bacterium]